MFLENFVKPPPLFFIAFLLTSLIFFFQYYRLWNNPDQIYEKLMEQLSRSPNWNPFKWLGMSRLKYRKFWEVEQKIVGAFATVILCGADIMLVLAFIYGK